MPCQLPRMEQSNINSGCVHGLQAVSLTSSGDHFNVTIRVYITSNRDNMIWRHKVSDFYFLPNLNTIKSPMRERTSLVHILHIQQ